MTTTDRNFVREDRRGFLDARYIDNGDRRRRWYLPHDERSARVELRDDTGCCRWTFAHGQHSAPQTHPLAPTSPLERTSKPPYVPTHPRPRATTLTLHPDHPFDTPSTLLRASSIIFVRVRGIKRKKQESKGGCCSHGNGMEEDSWRAPRGKGARKTCFSIRASATAATAVAADNVEKARDTRPRSLQTQD